ncbi:lytic polysaccharide monooxygenase auxiliary activity family 9 protein [Micromonospora radicis]|uniref:Chitin-binding protein n=1 Tax=Micromonospora radicis TaxID=1894971 RepID=A0A418MQK4_9ACTN|nr:lytic polysaccharide monooxygenase [Micromonospora radicis]RIV36041.1 chitin-binding protein [Micromonospora radicis]
MTVRRGAVALLFALVAVTAGAPPAAAHGAPAYPVSRTLGCAPDGPHVDTPACRAAVADGAALREWDNIRVFGVQGRDRERIPDTELCSGGLSAYRGLDLPRSDWPATPLTAGVEFPIRYRTTIPHKGTFRLYLTRDGYSPTRKLTWADLDVLPFLRATDPPVRDGAYQMSARLPADRTGRHLIYTIWRNSDTADTYYSCSDVDIRPAGQATDQGAPTADEIDAPSPDAPSPDVPSPDVPSPDVPSPDVPSPDVPSQGAAAGGAEVGGAEVAAAVRPNVPVAAVTYLDGRRWPLLAGGALAALLLLLLGMRLRGSRSGPPPGRPCTVRNHRANPRTW